MWLVKVYRGGKSEGALLPERPSSRELSGGQFRVWIARDKEGKNIGQRYWLNMDVPRYASRGKKRFKRRSWDGLILRLAGDIELNPGPRKGKDSRGKLEGGSLVGSGDCGTRKGRDNHIWSCGRTGQRIAPGRRWGPLLLGMRRAPLRGLPGTFRQTGTVGTACRPSAGSRGLAVGRRLRV